MCDNCRFRRRPLPEDAPRTALVHVPHLEVSGDGGMPRMFKGKRLVERPNWAIAAVSSRDGGEILWVSEPVTERIRDKLNGIMAASASTGRMRAIMYSPDTGWRNVWVAEAKAAARRPSEYQFQNTYKPLLDKTPEPKLYAVVAVASSDKAMADLDLIRRYSAHPNLSLESVQDIAERRSRHYPKYTFAVVEVLGTITSETQTKTTVTKSWEK